MIPLRIVQPTKNLLVFCLFLFVCARGQLFSLISSSPLFAAYSALLAFDPCYGRLTKRPLRDQQSWESVKLGAQLLRFFCCCLLAVLLPSCCVFVDGKQPRDASGERQVTKKGQSAPKSRKNVLKRGSVSLSTETRRSASPRDGAHLDPR